MSGPASICPVFHLNESFRVIFFTFISFHLVAVYCLYFYSFLLASCLLYAGVDSQSGHDKQTKITLKNITMDFYSVLLYETICSKNISCRSIKLDNATYPDGFVF